jgi:hypothetical protein
MNYRILILAATQSLVLTTTVPGVGLRKTPSSASLLHEIVSLIHREMEGVNCAPEARVLSLSFQVLTNSCQSQECRNIIAKVSSQTDQKISFRFRVLPGVIQFKHYAQQTNHHQKVLH